MAPDGQAISQPGGGQPSPYGYRADQASRLGKAPPQRTGAAQPLLLGLTHQD